MVFFEVKDKLSDEMIDSCAAQAENALGSIAAKRVESPVKCRLALEEILLRFRDCFGADTVCRVKGIKGIGGIRFEVSAQAAPLNPLQTNEEESLPAELLSRLIDRPRYTYNERLSLNTVTYSVGLKPRKNRMLIGIGIGVVLAVLTYLLSTVLPSEVNEGYLIPLVSGLFDKMSSIFSALATPLIFCAVITGIGGLGDVSSIGKIGGSLLKRMLLSYVIAMIAMIALGLPFGLVSGQTSSGGSNVFSDLLKLVLDIIPDNLVEPFRIDNDLQVIVIAIFVGIIMLTLGPRVQKIRELLDEAGELIYKMMAVICRMLPFFVYLGIANLLLSGRLSQISNVVKIIVITLGGAAITIAVTTIRTLIVTKKPFSEIFPPQIPSLLINLTTSSQVSALPESMKCCAEKWHISRKAVNFGMPFGMVVFMPNGAIMLGATAWVLTTISTGPVSITALVKLALVAVIVAIAAPPIPGSGFAVLPILFSACGTDPSMMPLAVIVISTVGYLMPAMNGYCLQHELLCTAVKTGMIEEEPEAVKTE